ncbi:tail fiber domain-containing protein [Bacillus cereus]|nr:tail fiber domain-containing protein [Bacillus cereus]
MPNLVGNSNVKNIAGVYGDNSEDGGIGVAGACKRGRGVWGQSDTGTGVFGHSYNLFGVEAESDTNTALVVTTRNRREMPALIINQWGTGDMIMGKDETNYVNFRVRKNGDTIVRNLMQTCDKNTKENFSDVSTVEILDKLVNIPIQSWNYKNTPPNERHIGPTAQDFKATFGFNGDDDTHISSVDLQGVTLAAIQGLNEKLKAENDELHKKLVNLEARLSALEFKG